MSQFAQPQAVSLSTTPGDGYEFTLLQSFSLEGQIYLLAMSENFPGQVFIVEHKGHEMSVVTDEQKLETLRQHVEALEQNRQTITVADPDGQQHVFQIVRQLQDEGETYLIGVTSGDDPTLAAFLFREEGITLATDPNVLNRLLPRMKAYTSQAMGISVETGAGEKQDLTVVGQLEIEGRIYVLAAAEDSENELMAFRQEGESLQLVTDAAEQALIQGALQQWAQG